MDDRSVPEVPELKTNKEAVMMHPNEISFSLPNYRNIVAMRLEAQRLGPAYCEAFNIQMARQAPPTFTS